VDGRWEATSYGAAGLARELEGAASRHGNATRGNLRFIRIFQAMSDMLEVASPVDGRTRFVPLQSARHMLQVQTGLAPDELLDASDLLEPLRASVKANMAAFR
jgi:hypothetical protein